MRSAVALSIGLLSLGASCAPKKNTEIMLAVQTDVVVPKDLDAIGVRVLSNGVSVFEQSFTVDQHTVRLPASLGLVEGRSPGPIDIEVTGQLKGGPRVLRRTRTSFAQERTVLLRMPLHFSCFDQPDCGDGKSCVAGQCQSATTDVSTAPDWLPDKVFADPSATTNAGCYDPSVCMPISAPLAASAADPCSFPITAPLDPSKGVALSLRLPTGSTVGYCTTTATGSACRVPLDRDPVEGWDYTDASRTTAKLSQGICARLGAGAFAGIDATGACGDKTPDVPYCSGPAYPPAPYGRKVGDVFPPIIGPGYVAGSAVDTSQLDTRTYFDPSATGAQRAIFVNVVAIWCSQCKDEAPNLVAGYPSYQTRGARFITTVTQSVYGGPPSLADATAWRQAYRLPWDVLTDVSGLSLPDPTETPDGKPHFPFSYVVDAKTMKVYSAVLGNSGTTSIPALDAFIARPPP